MTTHERLVQAAAILDRVDAFIAQCKGLPDCETVFYGGLSNSIVIDWYTENEMITAEFRSDGIVVEGKLTDGMDMRGYRNLKLSYEDDPARLVEFVTCPT